jgi:hypothetical protein
VEEVLGVLMDILDAHPHALYSAGIDPLQAGTMDAMMEQVREIFWDRYVKVLLMFIDSIIPPLSGSQGGCC